MEGLIQAILSIAKALKQNQAGTVQAFAGATAPTGWLLCDGSAVNRTTYADLYAIIGTAYGAGDGSTTFNLPDLRGRVPVGKNAGTFPTLGATGGSETVTLTPNQLAPGTLGARANSTEWAAEVGGFATGGAFGSSGRASSAGSSHTNLQPYQVFNWIIKY